MLTFNCPACSKRLTFPADVRGTVVCPFCKASHQIEATPFIAPATWKKIALYGGIGVVCIAIIGGWIYREKTWESRNTPAMLRTLDEIESLTNDQQLSQAIEQRQSLSKLVGSHRIEDAETTNRIAKIDEAIVQLQTLLTTEQQERERQQQALLEQQQKQLEENTKRLATVVPVTPNPTPPIATVTPIATATVRGHVFLKNEIQRGLPVLLITTQLPLDAQLQAQVKATYEVTQKLAAFYRDAGSQWETKAKNEETFANEHSGRLQTTSQQLAAIYHERNKTFLAYANYVERTGKAIQSEIDGKEIGTPLDIVSFHRKLRDFQLAVSRSVEYGKQIQDLDSGGTGIVYSDYPERVVKDQIWQSLLQKATVAKASTDVDGRYEMKNLKPQECFIYCLLSEDDMKIWEWFVPFTGKESTEVDLHERNVTLTQK